MKSGRSIMRKHYARGIGEGGEIERDIGGAVADQSRVAQEDRAIE